MSPSDDPPTWNTRATRSTRCRQVHVAPTTAPRTLGREPQGSSQRPSVHEEQTAPPSEEQPVEEQSLGSAGAQPETDNPHEEGRPLRFATASPSGESRLTPIAEIIGEGMRLSDEDNPPEYSVQAEHDTFREIPEDFDITPPEPEQSYMTAPVSFGPVAGPSTNRPPSPKARVDKGKGRAVFAPPRGESSSSHWSEREPPPHMAIASEEWEQLRDSLEVWTTFAEQAKEDAIQIRWDMSSLNSRVVNSYHRSNKVVNAIQGIRQTVERMSVRGEGENTPSTSPRALASQALYAERGSSEGTADYERRQRAQERLGLHRASQPARAEDAPEEISSPMTKVKAEETESTIPASTSESSGIGRRERRRRETQERLEAQLTESKARAALKKPRAQAKGPPFQVSGSGGGDPGGEPLDSSDDESGEEHPSEHADLGQPRPDPRDDKEEQDAQDVGDPVPVEQIQATKSAGAGLCAPSRAGSAYSTSHSLRRSGNPREPGTHSTPAASGTTGACSKTPSVRSGTTCHLAPGITSGASATGTCFGTR